MSAVEIGQVSYFYAFKANRKYNKRFFLFLKVVMWVIK